MVIKDLLCVVFSNIVLRKHNLQLNEQNMFKYDSKRRRAYN